MEKQKMIKTGTWWKVIAVLAIVTFSLNIFGDFFGKLEGRIWPVVENTKIKDITEANGRSTFYGETHKIRKCDFVSLEWYIVDPISGISSKLEFSNHESGKVRPLAPFEFGPWSVNVTKDELEKHSVGYVRHNCHIMFPTITKMYP